jgi:hypothetical protein
MANFTFFLRNVLIGRNMGMGVGRRRSCKGGCGRRREAL